MEVRHVCLTCFISFRTGFWEGEAGGCGRGGGQAGPNDRALFGTAALVKIGPSQTIGGHRSSETQGERANESVLN